jgi:alanine racemase
LDTVIHHPEQLMMLANYRTDKKINLFLKINTGMNRLGLTPREGAKAIHTLKNLPHVGEITLMTHLACADDPAAHREINDQLTIFSEVPSITHLPCSLANSAATIQYPQTHQHWVRPGIMLYGASPLIHRTATELDLNPVMTVSSKIIALQQLNTNDKVGYSGAFQAQQPMQIGIVAAGYADGYPRHAQTGTPIIVNGQRTRIVGRVSMDMLAVDLTGIRNVTLGSPVILWGDHLPIEEVAKAAGTISYELFCSLSSRVKVMTIE